MPAEVPKMTSADRILENRSKYAKYFDNGDRSDISIETFYQLLIAEMSNQDPMEPMSNTEFISQMASFAGLQVQQQALYYNNSNYAQSMAGKTVIVAANSGSYDAASGKYKLDVQEGIVSRVDFSGGSYTVTVNGKKYPLENIMEVLDSSRGAVGGSEGAFATSLIGKYVTIGMMGNNNLPIVEKGIVQRVEIKDGQISVVIGEIAYPLYSVAKVEDVDDVKAREAGGTTG